MVSAATAALVDVPLHDLGEHRFKDLRAPERVFQLGEGAFAALRSLQRSNLPVPATPFLGRAGELDDLRGLVTQASVRAGDTDRSRRDGKDAARAPGGSRRF